MQCVVTGASNGIGYETVLSLLENGHRVIAIARNEARLRQLQSLAGAGERLMLLPADISNEKELERIGTVIGGVCTSVDILINNAGRLVKAPFEELDAEAWKGVYATNVFGSAGMIRYLYPLLCGAGEKDPAFPGVRAHVVNVSSMGGVQGSKKFAGLSAYSSSKAAVIGLTECLAEEFVSKGIAVNCMAFGSVDTEMFAAAFPGIPAGQQASDTGRYLAQFAVEGWKFFNGKTIEFSRTTP